jgi:predicted DCC family thiol-disulfide oxidoreductase YuxK
MSGSAIQAASVNEGIHLVLYDGVCGLCNRLLRFLLPRDRRRVFVYAPLQSGAGRAMVARFGGNPDELTSFRVVANYRANDARMLSRSGAALLVAGQLGWPWKAAALMRVLPAAVLDPIYDIIARTRYRIFGRLDPA